MRFFECLGHCFLVCLVVYVCNALNPVYDGDEYLMLVIGVFCGGILIWTHSPKDKEL